MPEEITLSEGTLMGATSDPDAQATVSDFIDYTEYLPADLQRSLILIGKLDERYLEAAQAVHELTKEYGALPTIPETVRADPVDLRKRISEQLFRAISARECAYAEARRLYDVVDRHFDRLGSIRTKLENLNSPIAPLEGVTAGERSERKAIRGATRSATGTTTPTRLTLRLDPKKNANDRDLVDNQSPSTDSLNVGLQDIEKKPIPLRLKLTPTALKRGRKVRDLSEASTNEEINAIETSTRNALQMLKAPPEDAQIGSEHLPWLRLTEWELTRLRKRMKKNNTWQPSEVMVHRELSVRGRGWENYRRAKAHADETGEKLVDCDQIEFNYKPGQSIQGREIQAGQETRLTNRGMKLNEAKKLKRENLARVAALAAATAAAESEHETQSSQTTQIASRSSRSRTNHVNTDNNNTRMNYVDKMTRSRQASAAVTGRTAVTNLSNNASQANRDSSKDRESRRTRKRKSEDLEPSVDLDHRRGSTTVASRKKIHSGEELEATDIPIDHRRMRNTLSKQRQQSLFQTPEEKSGASRGESYMPLLPTGHSAEINKYTTPAATTTVGGRRNKRPAPGPVTSSQDGGTAVSVGRRKKKPATARPSKRNAPAEEILQQTAILDYGEARIDEDGVYEQVDPNEPRYCICGDVSFGTMICCEDDNCDKEWFHLECVGLTEVPSRTAKWYCPECRTKIAKANADGIVRHGSRR